MIYRERNLEEERNLEDKSQEEQYKGEGEHRIIQQIQDYLKDFEDILNQIDERIDRLDSYERTIQIKRSIDRLIETLYIQAASEDINAELETTKHTTNKSASVKKIREKRRRQVIEEALMFAKEQNVTINAKHIGHGHETAKEGDVHEAKEKVKSSIRGVLFAVIGNAMNPRKMAGETADSNEKGANKYDRKSAGRVLGALLKTFLAAVTAVLCTKLSNRFISTLANKIHLLHKKLKKAETQINKKAGLYKIRSSAKRKNNCSVCFSWYKQMCDFASVLFYKQENF